jgi:hypothetical protein
VSSSTFTILVSLLSIGSSLSSSRQSDNATVLQSTKDLSSQNTYSWPSELKQRGFVFVEGRFLAPPYEIRQVGDELFINDTTINWDSFTLRHSRPEWVNEVRAKTQNRHIDSEDTKSRILHQLQGTLAINGVLVFFSGHPVATIDSPPYEFLSVLVRDDARSAFINGERDWLPSGSDEQRWIDWIRDFDCPLELEQRANLILEKCDQTLLHAETVGAANRRLDRFAFPLTIIGMVLVVFSFGHLLHYQPRIQADNVELMAPQVIRAVRIALLLLVALSTLDLIWTLLVSQAGAMRELNPVGSALINNPAALIALKIVATGTAVSILLFLHRRPFAQLVSWWGCLIYTLVVFRWLTFNSMFIS